MSAFLGPIHYRMFGKAQALDGFARAIAHHADEQGWTSGLETQLETEHPRFTGEITDHIDLSNIHASLNGLVARAEGALEAACAPLESHLEDLVEFARAEGLRAAHEAQLDDADLQTIWTALDGGWLDGMPCDRMMRLTRNDPDTIAWSIDLAPHAQVGYGQIRTAWSHGFADGAGIVLESAAGDFSMRKEA